jgi:hypothetical protein
MRVSCSPRASCTLFTCCLAFSSLQPEIVGQHSVAACIGAGEDDGSGGQQAGVLAKVWQKSMP